MHEWTRELKRGKERERKTWPAFCSANVFQLSTLYLNEVPAPSSIFIQRGFGSHKFGSACRKPCDDSRWCQHKSIAEQRRVQLILWFRIKSHSANSLTAWFAFLLLFVFYFLIWLNRLFNDIHMCWTIDTRTRIWKLFDVSLFRRSVSLSIIIDISKALSAAVVESRIETKAKWSHRLWLLHQLNCYPTSFEILFSF